MTVYFSEVVQYAVSKADSYRDDHSDQVDLSALEGDAIKHFNLSRVEADDRNLKFFIRKALEHRGLEIKS